MIRYRIDRDARERYIVLPALAGLVPIDETYATRAEARDMADWLNRCAAAECRGQVERV